MQLLLDENAPVTWLSILHQLGHHAEHVEDHGLKGKSDEELFAFADEHELIVLSLNKFKRGPDRRAALTAMMAGSRIIRVTAKGLRRQEEALERGINEVGESLAKNPDLRRATIMNNFKVRYDTSEDIRRLLGRDA